jgi:hypothetical protein
MIMPFEPGNTHGREKGSPLSPAELRQRQMAAQKSTGPKTEKGKATASLNAWKTGMFSKRMKAHIRGKPCFSTCEKFNSCVFVLHEKTKPGGKCLDVADWEIVEETTEAIIIAMDSGDTSKLNAVAAAHMGMLLSLAHQMFMDIQQRGINVERLLTNKDGNVIGSQTVDNPHINNLVKILDKVGIHLTEFVATPMAQQKVATETEEAETAAAITRRLMDRLGPLSGNSKPIDAEVVKDD